MTPAQIAKLTVLREQHFSRTAEARWQAFDRRANAAFAAGHTGMYTEVGSVHDRSEVQRQERQEEFAAFAVSVIDILLAVES